MTRSRLALLGTVLLLTIGAGRATRTAAFGDEASTPKPGGGPASRLHVPDGFVVELVAAPPLVEHPMMAGFDERGRLFVAEAAGVNLKADELLKDPPNRIRLLEDTDGDGRFDKSTIFADQMTLPMGALWHRGALYTASPPSLWQLEDTDGDGVADRRAGAGHHVRLHRQRGRHPRPVPRPRRPPLLVRRPARPRHPAARRQRAERQGRPASSAAGPTARTSRSSAAAAWTTRSRSPSPPRASRSPPSTSSSAGPSRIDAIIYCIEGGRLSLPRAGPRRIQANRRPAAGGRPARLGRAVRADAVSRRGLRRRVSRQPLLGPVQRAAHPAAPARARRGRVPAPQRGLPRLRRPRLPSHRRAGRRRRQPARHRHRRLVPHRLPDVADRQAGDQGGDLPGAATRRASRPPTRTG